MKGRTSSLELADSGLTEASDSVVVLSSDAAGEDAAS